MTSRLHRLAPVDRARKTHWSGDSAPENTWSLWSQGSILSVGSVDSILSIGSHSSVLSIGSIGSACSVLGVGSAASLWSVGSAASRGSLFSAASAHAAFSIDSRGTVGGGAEQGGSGWAPGLAVVTVGAVMLADWWSRRGA